MIKFCVSVSKHHDERRQLVITNNTVTSSGNAVQRANSFYVTCNSAQHTHAQIALDADIINTII